MVHLIQSFISSAITINQKVIKKNLLYIRTKNTLFLNFKKDWMIFFKTFYNYFEHQRDLKKVLAILVVDITF